MANYQSAYTGAQIDAAVGNATKVVANPTLAGTESDLTGLEVAGVKYAIPAGGGGGSLYQHTIAITMMGIAKGWFTVCIINNSSTPFDKSTLQTYIGSTRYIIASGAVYYSSTLCVASRMHNYGDIVAFKVQNGDTVHFYVSDSETITDNVEQLQ